jgi:hypothetical protein
MLGSLLARRLLLVTGKGGTGKSSVAAALAVLAAREGVRTVLVELGRSDTLHELIGGAPPDAKRLGREPLPAGDNLFALRIVPEIALTEYLELQLRVKLVARAIVGNAGFHRFLDAAPGWRELITLGKLWYLATRSDASGAPQWPLLVVDAPATGHGLSLLSAPAVVLDTVRMGPLRRHTDRVQELLTNSVKTLLLPVTLPEELPVNETLELRTRVLELGVGLGPVFANGVEPPLGVTDPERVLARVAALPAGASPSPLAEPASVCAAASHRLARGALQAEFLTQLDAGLGERALRLPWLAGGVDGPDGVRALGDALRGALT